jgi:TRAP-type C4-dicarboxylate transport system substrate-binding protein
MNQIGAVPTPVPFSEIVPALQRGIVDAVMTSVGTANGFGFHTVADHISIWRVGTVVPWSFVVNNQAWEELPDDLKEAVTAEFRAIEDEHFANHAAYSQAAIDALQGNGMTVYYAPDDQQAAIFADENVEAVFDNWYGLNDAVGTDGRALVARIIEMRDEISQ